MTSLALQVMTQAEHTEDALDLATRAEDYVVLEIGHAADMAFIDSFFTATPPGLSSKDLRHFLVTEGRAIAGMVCIAQGYELPTDWWIGLVLLDPAFRGRGIGTAVLQLVQKRARDAGMEMLKLSVLEANPRATQFWIREGFVLHRYAPATPESDGHNRWVLKFQL